jgi:hypothetical protein
MPETAKMKKTRENAILYAQLFLGHAISAVHVFQMPAVR